MQFRSAKRPQFCRGFTLIESTLVILVLLSLVSVLFVASRKWKEGADRTACVLSLHQVQQAVRGYSNAYGKSAGGEVPGLPVLLFGEGLYIQKVPLCPSGGIYSFLGDHVPERGELYMKCSLAGEGHAPTSAIGW